MMNRKNRKLHENSWASKEVKELVLWRDKSGKTRVTDHIK